MDQSFNGLVCFPLVNILFPEPLLSGLLLVPESSVVQEQVVTLQCFDHTGELAT